VRRFPGLVAALACAALALTLPASALADGDPASDVLLTDTIYFPYTKPSADVTGKLRAVVEASRRAGVPVRVAIISTRQDLGAVPDYYGRPGEYAKFLSGELSAFGQLQGPTHGKANDDPLLIVMPAGFGTNGLPAATDRELRSIDLGGDASPDGLSSAAGYAVQEIAKRAGKPIKEEFKKPASASGGGSVLVPLLVGLGLALLAGVAIFARVKAQQNAQRAAGT
jgi:hypothetical protein